MSSLLSSPISPASSVSGASIPALGHAFPGVFFFLACSLLWRASATRPRLRLVLASSALLARCPLRRRYASFARGRHDRGCGGRRLAFAFAFAFCAVRYPSTPLFFIARSKMQNAENAREPLRPRTSPSSFMKHSSGEGASICSSQRGLVSVAQHRNAVCLFALRTWQSRRASGCSVTPA